MKEGPCHSSGKPNHIAKDCRDMITLWLERKDNEKNDNNKKKDFQRL
jgi:hypothetical protein